MDVPTLLFQVDFTGILMKKADYNSSYINTQGTKMTYKNAILVEGTTAAVLSQPSYTFFRLYKSEAISFCPVGSLLQMKRVVKKTQDDIYVTSQSIVRTCGFVQIHEDILAQVPPLPVTSDAHTSRFRQIVAALTTSDTSTVQGKIVSAS